MDRLPDKVLLHVLQHIRVRQRFRILRVNRKFNYLITTNCAGLRVCLDILYTEKSGDMPYMQFLSKDMSSFGFWMEIDNISFEVLAEHTETKMPNYLALKTGSHVIEKGERFVVPVPDPEETLFMLMEPIVKKATALIITIDTNFDADFRSLIYNRLKSAGSTVNIFEFDGKVPIKELLFLNQTLQTTHFHFQGLDVVLTEKEEKEGRQEEYNWKVDDLLRHQSIFSFYASWDYGFESWASIEEVIQDWKRGILNDIAASFNTTQFAYIRENLEKRPDVRNLGPHNDSRNYAIIREDDDKWLWMQFSSLTDQCESMHFAYMSMSGEIRIDLFDKRQPEKLAHHISQFDMFR